MALAAAVGQLKDHIHEQLHQHGEELKAYVREQNFELETKLLRAFSSTLPVEL